MVQFTPDQAADRAGIEQLINNWGHELDANDGLRMREADLLADDCRYNVGGAWRRGADEVARFYAERKQRLDSEQGAPVMRHIISNFRTSFPSRDQANVDFLLVFFARVGTPPFTGYCDPLAVADVRMECRRDGAGEWRIAMFDSVQTFRRS